MTGVSMNGSLQPKTALVSVSDKTGLVEFLRPLSSLQLLASGGTARALREAGFVVQEVAEYTASPEVLGGRVKTLHPRIHGGLLSRRTPDDQRELRELGGREIDLLVVNLYPFAETAARGASFAETVEQIDIGGVALLRAAAKNHQHVIAVCDPADYPRVAEQIASGGVTPEERKRLAAKVFAHTAAYDAAIAAYLAAEEGLPELYVAAFRKRNDLRYGENPHQSAAIYLPLADRGTPATLANAEPLSGKELSFNNYWDLAGAWGIACDFDSPAVAIVKHTNPCGLAEATTLARAYELALAGDPVSAYGSIIALNREVDAATAELIHATGFVECVAAPGYAPGVLERLTAKKQRRFLALGPASPAVGPDGRFIPGGLLLQGRDDRWSAEERVASKREPTPAEWSALRFAWRAVKGVKSNAIVLARRESDGAGWLVGVGAGQMSRVESCIIACRKAEGRAAGSVAASDAFFPMPDGVETLARAGVTAVIQPGGSKGDAEAVAAADTAGMAMVFTGLRHFKH